MPNLTIVPWQPLIRPPAPGSEIPEVPAGPLKALACRNGTVSVAFLVTTDCPTIARVSFTGLTCGPGVIPADKLRARLIGAVATPEAGAVMEILDDTQRFSIVRSASVYVTVRIPSGVPAGVYTGQVLIEVEGQEPCAAGIELEVAGTDLPDVHDYSFFLNVWANPATIARWHRVRVWSDEHFALLEPYIRDLASHGQKTAVVPICHQPWATQTYDPFPNAVIWKRRAGEYEFDFSVFDRYVELHEACGIDKAIHCYSIVQAASAGRDRGVAYTDVETGDYKITETEIGDHEWTSAWKAFFAAFRKHLSTKGWLDKTYIAFDERPEDVMKLVMAMLQECAPDLKIALAANTRSDAFAHIDDLCLSGSFNERGIAEMCPPERKAMGVAELLDPGNACAISKRCPEKVTTTYYVCCGPAYPNTFLFSPLVESRMLGWLAAQGGYDGFLRWSYNDWTHNPFLHPEHAPFPTGDVHFVYPGPNGPLSSLRWEQLLEGIQDYELAMLAASKMETPEDMVDYEQAISLACRNPNGREKSVGDIEIARRLLIPIAARV